MSFHETFYFDSVIFDFVILLFVEFQEDDKYVELAFGRGIFEFVFYYSKWKVLMIFNFYYFQFNENGFAVIENFLSNDEASELRNAGLELCKIAPEKDRKVFQTRKTESNISHLKDDYFLESANKIHYFYEKGALNENGDLLVDQSISLNKVKTLKYLSPFYSEIQL